VVEISSVRAKWWCEEGGYTSELLRATCVGNRGDLLIRTTRHKRGSLELNGYNCSSDETLVGMYKLKEAMEKACSDL
jgi:hypothetical protein